MKKLTKFLFVSSLVLLAQGAGAVTVNSDLLSSGDFTLQPPVLTARETPLVMLGLSVDNQLFYKAYTDYTDIDSDGLLDTTYKGGFDYFGYFDSKWCYDYDETNKVFTPDVLATGPNGHSCDGSNWSGNFLNWATMTRIDILRRVLYGGQRSTDTDSGTILERAYIPSDVHAFAKVYSGSDINTLTPFSSAELTNGTLTICNVSSAHPYTSTSLPEMRLASGNYRRWSINEATQCQWDSGDNAPPSVERLNERVVRVQACVAGKDADSADCKAYSNGTVKPVGLLQQYGDSGELKFGLISGSYENYVSGGRLRKNIGFIGSNPDPALDEVSQSSGRFNAVDGIISSIDSLRIIGWNGSTYTEAYACGDFVISVDDFESKTKPCRDWGNPVAEIYAEAVRYFAGATAPTAAYSSGSDTTYIAALKDATWPASLGVNPLNANTACAACSIIMISSGVGSFDGNELDSVADIEGLSGVTDVAAKTDAVGVSEYGSFPQSFLIGDDSVAGNNNENLLCTSKTIAGLSKAFGLCPEAPALEGGFLIAGLANHAKTTDLRTDAGMTGRQSVDTYGVELSESAPKIDIKAGAGLISFLPACQAAETNGNDWSPCSLFDVEVLKTERNAEGNIVSGTLLFYWEASSWGSDYDLDGAQVVSFCVGGSSSACDSGFTDDRTGATYDDSVVESGRVRFTQGVAYSAAGRKMRFGIVVSGSEGNDGVGDWLERPGGQNRNDLCQLSFLGDDGNPVMPIPNDTAAAEAGCTDSQNDYAYNPEDDSYEPSATPGANVLTKPLLLAAKYGGFRDLDGSGDPSYNGSVTDTREWDLVNNRTGANGRDGVPDNYFYSSNPGLLAGQLQRIFASLVARTASGTNAAVVANTSSGIGAVYQALYQPRYSLGSQTVTWTGTLRGIFIDDAGNLREDSNGNAQLDDYATDKRVGLYFDPSLEKTFVQRYAQDVNGNFVPSGAPVDVHELKPIWSAVDRLALSSAPDEQRASYGNVDTDRRYILTALDRNADDEVDQNDVVPLLSSSLSSVYANYHEYFGLSQASEAPGLVDYLRGKEVAGYRSRTIDYDQDGISEVWRLGDIIHSTPAVVATPKENYGDLFSDPTYEAFVNQYRNRRQVVYVGANDGMIHAFNGGFWDSGSRAFMTQPTGAVSVANRPLGQELWAYAPYNLLPHLRWLTEQDYQHVYYMDGEPLTFDANVFPNDATHTDGWGTILAVGMRFGGSPIQISVDGGTEVMRSGYVLFDVTDPEQAPRLLGEITAPDLGFTLAKPAVINNRQPAVDYDAGTIDWDNPAVNDWYLVLGSGPRGTGALSSAESDQTPRLFAIDLEQLVSNSYTDAAAASVFTTIAGGNPLDLGGGNGFVGGIEVSDWDNSNSDDALYVGTVEGPAATPIGQLHRILLEDNDGESQAVYGLSGAQHSVIMNPAQPIQATPITTRDRYGERWILFGTGKLLVPVDNNINGQQHFYGIKEPRSNGELTYGPVSPSALVDTTDIAVFESSGEVKDISSGTPSQLTIGGVNIDTFSQLESEMTGYPGWKVRMHYDGSLPSGRVTGHATLNPANRSQFAFTEYVPPAQSCDLDGDSYLRLLSLLTGTSTPDAPLSTSSDHVVNDHEMSLSVVSIGAGYASSVTFHQGGTGTLNAITNMSTGSINTTATSVVVPASGRQSWRQIDTLSF
ncbi:pilus assembly protein [Marinobacter mobilis]|uniref:Type IV pilus assembly protein PilY1 n=1 Tax=Marinobacter mobilis TaxID=488533 RepID=A0A1H3B5P0_9GAMM|nr:PilC/PilY family type IV pilus protein [Marinobacter mobilis]SDX36998.1 type IV pilus assembly protein PilY1 [Marinobacter mobilis]